MSAGVRAAVRAALREAGHADAGHTDVGHAAARDAAARDAAVGDLELAVHEVLANAHEHGRPPVEVAVRRDGRRVEVVVRDAGTGPVGAPAPPVDAAAERGRGRWLAHRLAVVEERRTPAGYEVRLTARGGAEGGTG